MSLIETEEISLDEIYQLALNVFSNHGCDADNANALARTVTNAERDGSLSHGLFRISGYLASLKSGKVKGDAQPIIEQNLDSVILINSHHFAALWPETEFLAERGLSGIACTVYKPAVAPAGASKAFFGTNPISFSWPRPNQTPLVFDMATSTLAMGDVQIAAREGHTVPHGTGLGPDGKPSDDPAEILKGVLLPFGGYKGSAISLMVELLAAGMTGESFSYEAEKTDNNDGGPPKGGELVLAINPELVAGKGWAEHSEDFLSHLKAIDGVRLPGERRHKNRLDKGTRQVNKDLLSKVRSFL